MLIVLTFLLCLLIYISSMSSADKKHPQDEASRNDQEASSSDILNKMKRAAAKKLIERYFYQLTDGCGNPQCQNKFCASSGEVNNITPNQAAAKAIELFSKEAQLCERHPTKMARTQEDSVISILPETNNEESNSSVDTTQLAVPCNEMALTSSSESTSKANSTVTSFTDDETVPYLTEEKLLEIIDECETCKQYSKLIRTLGQVFSNISSLTRSFRQTPSTPIDAMLDIATGDFMTLKKEDVRSLEGEKDKDEDSCVDATSCEGVRKRMELDYPSLRRSYAALFNLPNNIFESAMVNALVSLAGYLQMELQTRNPKTCSEDDIVDVLIMAFEIPALGSGDFLETAFPALCRATKWLTVDIQAKLAYAWAGPGCSSLRSFLENLHQLVTLRVILSQFHPDFFVQDENVVTAATSIMRVLYYSNILAGALESPELNQDDETDLSNLGRKLHQKVLPVDELAAQLGINVLDCRKPFLPFSEFYNEPLSDVVEMDKDFANYKGDIHKFSFMRYPFILTPATKTLGLYYDNRIRMFSERRNSFLQNVSLGTNTSPYLRLRVRREHIIDDALVALEMVALENPIDLKKQLVVEFEGEQGIDEGGVSKEFFQLVVEEIFNPDYAMFTFQNDSQTTWFNPTSFETESQFTLIGVVLGLAIYNNVILSVNFPMVLYRKLMGKKGSFEDLAEWNPTLYNSLKQLLEYTEDDIEDVFMQTFRVSYQDVFGTLLHHDLMENGDQTAVNQNNKREFVKLYADFLLNKSVEKQFKAFYKGFQMVVDESPLEMLFRPEEVELLICGSKNFDFIELENATEYDGGYTNSTLIVRHFWSVVHAFSSEEQRKLLQFTTGSDRVPIGGLSKLKMVIARNGPDSDRLPTAHTCFNVLLLPEYLTKEKLKDRLIKAINYSKGFGML
ncbi:PREDICTED: ubiquitin-protein ligase E3A isoform X2 [Nicrophorus vespilloides]|uniref:HECT-type E3 ubiquitin transferase n=1 Tax=Nicrophorus vespilloides TaxID=110193 RepID=A0ABM1MBY6_NICVS|nr:PREDICTED: ubiquitin-protein ligase E3A isoform X2 [Nicrophorus vespilloides]